MGERARISVIGAGSVGSSCAQRLAEWGSVDVVLLDIVEGLPQGKALDIQESAPVLGFDSRVTGTNSYRDTAGSTVVVITSGLPRKPGMGRDELAQANRTIVGQVTRDAVRHSPECVLVVATNPVDAMISLAIRESGFPRERVIGLSGVLDSARLSTFVARELSVSVADVHACVIGEHGSHMVVVPRLTTVSGVPITELLPADRVRALVDRTIGGGAEIVGLLKTGSAFYAPSAAIAQMVDAIVLDRQRILSCAVRLDGEYGLEDTVISVPVRLGANGVKKVIELGLLAEEMDALKASADAVRKLVRVMDRT